VAFSGPQKYYYLLLLITIGVVVVNLRLQNRALAARGKRSAKTRLPPRRWVSIPAT